MTILPIMSLKLALKYRFKLLSIIGIAIILCCCTREEVNEAEVIEEKVSVEPIDFDLANVKKRGSLVAIVDNSSSGYFFY